MGTRNALARAITEDSMESKPANALWASGRSAEKGWAKDAGNNTPNVAQAFTPDNFSVSPSATAAASALAASLRGKDTPLEDTYQPADFLTAFFTGGAGIMPKVVSAAMDPIISAGMDYVPTVLDAINPRKIWQSLHQGGSR